MNKVKMFVMDVDGTMTDGKIYMGADGELFKAFDIKDGYGIHEILPQNDVLTVILTGRISEIVLNRARELEIDYVLQNVKNKPDKLKELAGQLHIELTEVAYIGDDVIDLQAMKLCGVKGCPLDAVKEVKEICDFVSQKKGGEGAVRDFIEWLVAANLLVGGEEA